MTVKSRIWRHADDGSILWQHDLPSGNCDFSMVTRLVTGPEGETYLLGSANPASMLARIEPDGSVAWTESFGGDGIFTGFRDIAMTPNGRLIVVVTEASADDVTAFDVRVLCCDTTGTLGWTTLFAGPGAEADLLGAVAAGADESAAVVATVNDPVAPPDIATLRFAFPPCTGDLDGDGVVGGADLGILLAAWGDARETPADLHGDGLVNGIDVGLLLGAWGACPTEG